MQYRTLLLATLVALSNAAATPHRITVDYARVSQNLALLAKDITSSGPSAEAIRHYNIASSALSTFSFDTGDSDPEPHPCPPLLLKKPTTKDQADDYIKSAEKLVTSAYRTAAEEGSYHGSEICQASQYVSFVGQYVGASA